MAAERSANELETLRVSKDARIRAMEREKEDQRSVYEARIGEMDSKIKSKKLNVKLD
jgi:hypothetical protein